jgi:hypothetical protein
VGRAYPYSGRRILAQNIKGTGRAKRDSGIPFSGIQAAIDLLADPPTKKPRKPRPRNHEAGRGMHDNFEFEPPDLAWTIRHLTDRWYGRVTAYEPTKEQLAVLDVDLPQLLPTLVQLAERLGLEVGVRLTEPRVAPTVDAEPLVVDSASCWGSSPCPI